MKKTILIAFLVGMFSMGIAQTVDIPTAQKYAEQFLYQQFTQKSAVKLQLYCTDVPNQQKSAAHFYVFRQDGGGFVIMSADRRCKPVLAYSTTATFDTTALPDHLRQWLQGYGNEISRSLSQAQADRKPQHPAWTAAALIEEVVSPLVKTHWNQSSPYNVLCPMDIASQTRCPTGCVATAMAQVMNYWKYPVHGLDSHAFRHLTYGLLSADFANTTYDWEHMLNEYKSSYSKAEQRAVSLLMYHCGVSLDMNYGPRGSDANTFFNVPGYVDAPAVLMQHFGYDTAFGKIRDNFDPKVWTDMLKEELDNGRPLMYRGTGYGGHSFVCDGYDSEDNFHFNWGWGGSCDGFYSLTAMNPNGYDFSQYQAAVFIHPTKDSTDYRLVLKKNIIASSDTARLDSTISFSACIHNTGRQAYLGAFTVGLYHLDGQWAGCMEETHHQEIAAGDSLQLDFRWTNLNEFQPGVYIARICAMQSKRWVSTEAPELNYVRLLILGSKEEKRLQLLEDVRMLSGDTLRSADTLKLQYRVGGGKKPCIISYIVRIPYLLGDETDYLYISEHCITHPEDETQLIQIPISRMSGKISGRYFLSCSIADRTTGAYVVSNGHSDTCSFFYQADVADLRISGAMEVSPQPVLLGKAFEIRVPVSNRGNIPYTNNTYIGIYDTSFQLLTYAGPMVKCQLAPGSSDTLRFNTISKKNVLEEGFCLYACLLYNSANSSTDQLVKADKGQRNLLEVTIAPADYGTEDRTMPTIRPYPNPTADMLYLDLPHEAEVQVLNMEGKVMYRASFPEGKIRIDFGAFPKGAYLIRTLESDGSQRTFRAIAQ